MWHFSFTQFTKIEVERKPRSGISRTFSFKPQACAGKSGRRPFYWKTLYTFQGIGDPIMQDTTQETKQYQCRHIFTDGRRCASPCLRQEEFCYYHHTTRKPVENPRARRTRRSTFDLPLPEDRSAIQSSIGEVLRRIASNDIDPRRAGLLLYGLQIASLNLPKDPSGTRSRYKSPNPETVEDITVDPSLGILAPRAEVGQTERKTVLGRLLESMLNPQPPQPDPPIAKTKPEPIIEPETSITTEPEPITEPEPSITPEPELTTEAVIPDDSSTTPDEPSTIPTIQATAENSAQSIRFCRHPERRAQRAVEGPRSSRRTPTDRIFHPIQFKPSFTRINQDRHPPQNRHFDRSAAKWRNPLLHLNTQKYPKTPSNKSHPKIVISTGAQRSGETRFSTSTLTEPQPELS
jgi:hypothetical protein